MKKQYTNKLIFVKDNQLYIHKKIDEILQLNRNENIYKPKVFNNKCKEMYLLSEYELMSKQKDLYYIMNVDDTAILDKTIKMINKELLKHQKIMIYHVKSNVIQTTKLLNKYY